MSIFDELRRRNVLRVAAAYVVAAWLIIQVVETIFPAFGFGDVAIRLVVIVLAIGFVPAVVFAWVFELTPEGLRKEKDVDRTQSITRQTAKRLDRIIMLVLAVALGFFAIDKFVLDPVRDEALLQTARDEARSEALIESYGEKSIAVLPFVDMSLAKDQEHMSDGIAEELLNLLAKVPELRVISRSSAFTYKGKDLNLVDVARELDVQHILEGSVRTTDSEIRITAQLIDARSDTHLWSETYDRPLDDIFKIQDEIAAQVVDQLKLKLLDTAPVATTTDPAAYEKFLQAKHLRQLTSAESAEQAKTLLQEVLSVDPDYVPALDELATLYVNEAHASDRSFQSGYEQARSLVMRGLAAAPNSSRMHGWLAWIQLYYDNDLQAAARSFERALSLGPDAAILGDAASFLALIGRMDEAIELDRVSIARDPFHPGGYANYANHLADAGNFDDAIAAYRKASALSPDYYALRYSLGLALVGSGDFEAALIEMDQEPVEGYRLAGLAIARHALGDHQRSDAALEELINAHAHNRSLNIAHVYAFRGEIDEAFEWIDKAIEAGHSEVAEINTNILFENLHGDPRWHPVLGSLEKSPEQLAAIEFDPPTRTGQAK